jgi:hypothetical protein
VRLDQICEEYFGLLPVKALEHANAERLPIPTFRLRDSIKAPRLVNLEDLAKWIDSRTDLASQNWQRSQKRNG